MGGGGGGRCSGGGGGESRPWGIMAIGRTILPHSMSIIITIVVVEVDGLRH